jgi:NitT/TauT family transport system permease protein
MVSYPRSLVQSAYTLLLIPLIAIVCAVVLLRGVSIVVPQEQVTLTTLLLALGSTFLRLLAAYVLSLICAVPLALLVTHNEFAERIFLPLFDVMQSVPVLAFFPVLVVFFVRWGAYDGAAIFILFVTMLWSIVFSLVGGLRIVPQDIKSVGKIFGLRKFAYLRRITLPAVFPYLITGSLLAWASGWNIIIIAEVLHTYLPGATENSDLCG